MTGAAERRDATTAMIARWSALLSRMSATPSMPRRAACDRPGELVILGSGMAHTDLMLNDEAEIRAADDVFYCLYDRVTQIWIDGLRPDALDLRILYGPELDRHDTYIRMAEAMLEPVRRGRKVVAVYYGHPGIFATPTHRALRIARQEGHRARMRPGISALDYLIADVGFDPMMPGLLSYEASDLILRRRRLDPALHLVLWQVGVVGEFQFDPAGFQNKGFGALVDVLERAYGPSWEITHYIAPQYVGVEPLIERHAIGALRDAEIAKRFNAMSTFYIAPQEPVAIDPAMSVALGFTRPGEPTGVAENDFDIASYGRREIDALRGLANFRAPAHYAIAERTPGAEFMLALSRDLALQARYRRDPADALRDPRFAQLSERARNLLAIPHPLAINAAIAEPAEPPPA